MQDPVASPCLWVSPHHGTILMEQSSQWLKQAPRNLVEVEEEGGGEPLLQRGKLRPACLEIRGVCTGGVCAHALCMHVHEPSGICVPAHLQRKHWCVCLSRLQGTECDGREETRYPPPPMQKRLT